MSPLEECDGSEESMEKQKETSIKLTYSSKVPHEEVCQLSRRAEVIGLYDMSQNKR